MSKYDHSPQLNLSAQPNTRAVKLDPYYSRHDNDPPSGGAVYALILICIGVVIGAIIGAGMSAGFRAYDKPAVHKMAIRA